MASAAPASPRTGGAIERGEADGARDVDAAAPTEAQIAAWQEAARGIIDRLDRLAQEQVQARAAIEQRWLDDLRAYHGRYDEKTEAALNEPGNERSRAFIKLTRARTDAWESRLSDMLFPVDDDNWGIAPTPVPELTRAAQDAIALARAAADKANAAADQGMAPEQVQAFVARGNAAGDVHAQVEAELAEAKTRCAAMALQIKDQLSESQYGKRCRDVIRDACRLGPGILKGPMTGNRPARSWVRGADGAYGLDIEPAQRPEFRRVDPWAFFPDRSATSMDDIEFSFERHLPSVKELKAMARKLGFDPQAVRRLVEGGRDGSGGGAGRSGAPTGSDRNLHHLADLRAITGEGDAISNRFVMWEYHGPLETGEVAGLLRAIGRHDDAEAVEAGADPIDEHMVIAFFCEGELLQLREAYPLDSGESLYSVFSLQQGEASIMGAIGVPRLMYDSQRAMNGAWRMVLDNAALSVGPQIVVDKSQIEPADGNAEISPNKLWWKTGRELGAAGRPFETFDIPLNQAQLGAIITAAREFADEETSMPMIAQGDQGAHVTQTMGGMAMLMNSANTVIRRVVKNWDDDLTSPSIRRLYDWNMQFGADDAIKGDMKVQARGTSVLLVKELQAQNLLLVADRWSLHAKLGLMLKSDGYQAARMTLQSMSIPPDEIFKSEEEYLRDLEKAAGSPAAPPEQIGAQARIEAATIAAKARAASDEIALRVATIAQETEMMRLAEQRNMKVEDLQAMLAGRRMDNDSAERKLAVEIAVEDQNRRRAEAQGMEPTGSGGAISMGAKPRFEAADGVGGGAAGLGDRA